jgi:hypothetical protein
MNGQIEDQIVVDAPAPSLKSVVAPIKTILSLQSASLDVFALPSNAKILLGMHSKNQADSRVLPLLAQRDPIYLTHLLCLASSKQFKNKTAITANEAFRTLRTEKTLEAMLSVTPKSASKDTTSLGSINFAVDQYILQRCQGHALTVRRLARYLELTGEETSALYIACLLDSVCLYAGIAGSYEAALQIQIELFSRAASETFLLRDSSILCDYHLLAVHLARKWEANCLVVETLTPSTKQSHALLIAVEHIVEAKRRRTSQQQALFSILGKYPNLKKRLRNDEIDLAEKSW